MSHSRLQHRQLSVINVGTKSSSSLASRTQDIVLENEALVLGDAVAHNEIVFCLVYRTSSFEPLAKPKHLMKLVDNGSSTC